MAFANHKIKKHIIKIYDPVGEEFNPIFLNNRLGHFDDISIVSFENPS